MELKKVAAVLIAIVEFEIGKICKDEGNRWALEDAGSKFAVCVPGRVAKQLVVGDVVSVVCYPVGNLSFSINVFFLSRKTSSVTPDILIGKNSFWHLYWVDSQY